MKKYPILVLAMMISGMSVSAYAEDNAAKTDTTVQEKPVAVTGAETTPSAVDTVAVDGEKKPEAVSKKSGEPEPDCN